MLDRLLKNFKNPGSTFRGAPFWAWNAELKPEKLREEIRTMKDGWTVKTKDRSLSAQYEHTIVVTDNGCEILTLRKDDTIPAIISHDE